MAAGLANPTVKSWDQSISTSLAAVKTALGDRWSDVWLQAPVWRFALPGTMCGPAPLLGLWMPSIDKAGRHFPLMIAATCPGATPEQMRRHGTAWLDAAEDAGRDAIADDLTPEQLTASIPPPPDLTATPDIPLPDGLAAPTPDCGGRTVRPSCRPRGLSSTHMPGAAAFRAMLDSGSRP